MITAIMSIDQSQLKVLVTWLFKTMDKNNTHKVRIILPPSLTLFLSIVVIVNDLSNPALYLMRTSYPNDEASALTRNKKALDLHQGFLNLWGMSWRILGFENQFSVTLEDLLIPILNEPT